jgi:pantoate--beta-alanine ligase
MELIESVTEWRRRRGLVSAGRTVGFVPTMGSLHSGHRSLLARARSENEICVLSIFVNPPQFNSQADLEMYPRTIKDDLAVAQDEGVDFVLCPPFEEMYPEGVRYLVTENALSRRFCGAHRPGHFDAVLTVVLKLLLLINPRRAYFGEKDYQQLLLVRDMAGAFFLETEIVPCPTVRDWDGLALSSRNRLLTPEQRSLAVRFPRVLASADSAVAAAARLREIGFRVDYVEDFKGRRLAAVHVGPVRLIDNVLVGVHGAVSDR